MKTKNYLPAKPNLKNIDLYKYIESELKRDLSTSEIRINYKKALEDTSKNTTEIAKKLQKLDRIIYLHFKCKNLLDNNKKLIKQDKIRDDDFSDLL